MENLASGPSQITRVVQRKLKMIQYHARLIDGCLTGTGMTLAD
ncbi:hypothetical protein ACFV13_00525 [Streptomyces bauhiniae]